MSEMSSTDYSTFTPNADMLESMLAMGIDSETAKIALYKTGNESCDAAIAYVFDNNDEMHSPREWGQPSSGFSARINSRARGGKVRRSNKSEESDSTTQPYKMVFVVNGSLDMGVGKIASQVAHGALGLYRSLLEAETANSKALEFWEEGGESKIVLRGQHQEQLLHLRDNAHALGLLAYLVHDAGLTEVGVGALTVLGIFGIQEQVDTITSDLSLL